MDKFYISVYDNNTLFQIIKEIKLFKEYKIKHYEDFNLCVKDAEKKNHLVILFLNSVDEVKNYNFPLVLIDNFSRSTSKHINSSDNKLVAPFTIFELKKKIISVFAKSEFKKNSLINLKGYVVDKNERKIKRNNLELQLSEKEVNFLILFSENSRPIKRDLVLEKVWNYSRDTETHTVETHIHKLRKKILNKFNDSDFIKSNKKGYYI